MSGRAWFPMSADLLIGINPAVNKSAAVVWVERTSLHAVDFIIDGQDAAYNARRLAALLLSASEAVDPRGYQLILPEEDLEPAGLNAEEGLIG